MLEWLKSIRDRDRRQTTCIKIIYNAQGTCIPCRRGERKDEAKWPLGALRAMAPKLLELPCATIEPTQKTIVQVTHLTILNEALVQDSSPAQQGSNTARLLPRRL